MRVSFGGNTSSSSGRSWLAPALLASSLMLLAAMGYLAWTVYQSHAANQESAMKASLSDGELRQVARALDEEVMRFAVPHNISLDRGFKNPCWHDELGLLRCLPYAYIMGSFQSGGNTLFQKLAEHPDVITNDGSRWQFWAEDAKAMTDYVSKHSTGRTAKELHEAPEKKVILDGSASTFAFYWSAGLRAHRAFQRVMVPCWQQCAADSKGKAEAVRQCTTEKCYPGAMAADIKVAESLDVPHDMLHLPLIVRAAYGPRFAPKLVVLLRNPIDRLHCAYWAYPHYHGKYGKSAEGFLAYVQEQVGVLKRCAERFTGTAGPDGKVFSAHAAERHCALYFEALGPTEEQLFFHADQVIRGLYDIFLEVWMLFFPQTHLLVLKSEEYFANNEATLRKVMAFLGLEQPVDDKILKKMVESAGKPTRCTKDVPDIQPEARQILLELYRPHNEHLAVLLHDPKWLDYSHQPG